ncbi:diguanylate cyclase domain-containing protein [Rhodalgimonas zhirmunskyi]|uniref:diguanylate cyclase n=1 Tax=Rhodalgimonas zhirmunskyi TaxID=2964767 RepID=A0AAJ1U9C0_9RHOB|nr:diguanylate cyclase [Rhodoalgimonas zhirmunskyi]MDQ2095701.1 diguanylate cyclase [Rhodoalgimonas zhirmunskyi]
MPGKVLIIDDIATNRIVLKVKLAAACYQVAQASTAREGIHAARALEPDLILCSAQLPDMAPDAFLRALRTHACTASIPIVAITSHRDATRRLALLEGGADDVLVKPWEEHLLLARLRSLLRQNESALEGHLREDVTRALGMAEGRDAFDHPSRIALIAPTKEEALRWKDRLLDHMTGRIMTLSTKAVLSDMAPEAIPDAYVLFGDSAALRRRPETGPDRGPDNALHLLADLRARHETRNSAIIVVLSGENAQDRAADALDRGANDAIGQAVKPREIAVRLRRQIARKRRLDKLRADVASGLKAAVIDPLTGLYNRRYALPRLAAITSGAYSSETSPLPSARFLQNSQQTGKVPRNAPSKNKNRRDYAVMILDIDHFKLINDGFGHAAGDAVLERIGNVLREFAGPDDLAARIGGEEFLLALPDTTPQAARQKARQLCETIRETVFIAPGVKQPLQVTVSIGLALASDPHPRPHMAEPDWRGAQAMLERADQALYSAKSHGRNQVIVCTERSAA